MNASHAPTCVPSGVGPAPTLALVMALVMGGVTAAATVPVMAQTAAPAAPAVTPSGAALKVEPRVEPKAESNPESKPDRPWPAPLPRWEVGALGLAVSQQAYPGADQQVQRQLLLPYIVYRGEVLRADRGNAGLRALRGSSFEVDLGASAALGSSAQRIEARRGLPDLGTLLEVGPRLRWTFHRAPDGSTWRLDLPVRAVLDLNDGLQRRGITFEPEVKWQGVVGGGWFINTGLSALVGDTALARTFYGVPASAATLSRPAYEARSGLVTWRAAGALGRRIAPDWNLFAYARLDSVAGAANEASPLVRQTHGMSAGLGLSYVWRRSAAAAAVD